MHVPWLACASAGGVSVRDSVLAPLRLLLWVLCARCVLVWVRSRESQSKKIVVSLVLVLLSATNVESGSARVGRRATSRARAPLGEVGGGVWDARVSGSGSKIGALGLFRARVRVRVRARGPKGHE